jgi:hypothetical protein
MGVRRRAFEIFFSLQTLRFELGLRVLRDLFHAIRTSPDRGLEESNQSVSYPVGWRLDSQTFHGVVKYRFP